jgi:hypothetical protein
LFRSAFVPLCNFALRGSSNKMQFCIAFPPNKEYDGVVEIYGLSLRSWQQPHRGVVYKST